MRKALTVLGAALLAVLAYRRHWSPRTMHVSPETLDDIARRLDTAGLGEINTKDAHPFATERIRVFKQDRPGVDSRFRRVR